MQQSFSSFLSIQSEPYFDIFSKYVSGEGLASMPFKLYLQDNIQMPIKKLKKRNSRGPYRRYTPQEKRNIIQRILQGQPLKAIAEETCIPKRNLIRWKHEFLTQEKVIPATSFSSDDEMEIDSRSLKQGTVVETKEILSESNMEAEKIVQ